MKNERVKGAYQNYLPGVKKLLLAHQIPEKEPELFIMVLKREKLVEVWAKGRKQNKFKLIRQYPFCAISGQLGPKRQKGDRQIPEGFYFIDRFHPTSKFYLSLGLNYPNPADLASCGNAAPGGDIFIHGGCLTIGCIPITNTLIEELYVLAVEARNAGQTAIPVHVFPGRLDLEGYDFLQSNFSNNPALLQFWQTLQPVYKAFEESRTLPEITLSSTGQYQCEK